MKPQKKLPETDDIFENVDQANRAADADPKTLRISIDSKAKVKIGNLSRADAEHVRAQHLGLVDHFGTSEQQQVAIIQTQTWLDDHPDVHQVRAQYLISLARLGTSKQQQVAIAQTQT